MAKIENRVLFVNKSLPIRAGDLCELIESGARLENIDPDTMISGVSFLQRYKPLQKGFLLIGSVSSDSYIRKRVGEGAAAALVNHAIDGVPCIVVNDVLSAVFDICRWMYGSVAVPSVIVSGSAGKTTTKRLISDILGAGYQVYSTNENRNMLQELCCYLQDVKTGDQMVVWEVCENLKRHAAYSSKVLKPDIVVVTNIGDSHLGSIGGKEAQLQNFRELTAGMDESGVVIINADDRGSVKAVFNKTVVRVGIHDTSADCVAFNIVNTRKGTAFDLCFRNETVRVVLSVFGVHNVYNSMMAYVVGVLKGIGKEAILKALKNYHNTGIRQNIIRFWGTTIYADCYNSSGKALSYAIPCFSELPGVHGKRVGVLGDIAEIEGYEESTYREVAATVDDSSLDMLLTVGTDSAMIHKYVKRDIEKHHFASRDDLNTFLRMLKHERNGYLFKASRSAELELCIKKVFPMHYYPMKIREKFTARNLW